MLTREADDLVALAALYVEDLQTRRYSPTSVQKARFELPRLLQHLAASGVQRARLVTEVHLVSYARQVEFRETRRGTLLSSASRASALTTVRRFFAFLARRRHLTSDPAGAMPLPKGRRLPRGVVTPREARRLVRAPCPGSRLGMRDRAILETLYGTGIRLGEAVRADLLDLDLDERVLLIRCGKGSKDRVVPVPRRALVALRAYIGAARPILATPAEAGLFVSRYGRRLSMAGLRAAVQRHGRQAGLVLSPHTLRHTCATHLLRGGASIRHVQALLGHRSLATTAIYTRVAIEDLRRVIARAHPRP